MRRQEQYLYVGIDLHKETHLAVILNCWNEFQGKLQFDNRPSEFHKLVELVNKKCKELSKKDNSGILYEPIYGLENAYGYGRSLALYQNQLHEQLVHAYPRYKDFFTVIDRPTALYFWVHILRQCIWKV